MAARSMQKLGTYFDFLIPKKWPISKCFSGKILSSTSPEIMRSGLNSRPIACFSTTTIFFTNYRKNTNIYKPRPPIVLPQIVLHQPQPNQATAGAWCHL